MNILQQQSLHQLIGQSNLADAGADELFQLTDSHPYFSVPHFFLAKKLKEENHSGFINQLQKATLFFRNPYWLHYQLSPTTQQIQIVSKDAKEEITAPLLNNVIQEEIEHNIQEAKNEIAENTIEQNVITEKVIEEVEIEQAPSIVEIAQEIVEQNVTTEETIEATTATEQAPSMVEIAEQLAELNDEVTDTLQATTTKEEIDEVTIAKADDTTVTTDSNLIKDLNETQTSMNSIEFEIPQKNIVVTEQTHSSITSFALEATEENEQNKATEETINSTIISISSIEDIDTVLDDIEVNTTSTAVDEKLTSILKEQLEAFKQPVTSETKLDIETEPYHTVDYFASQGIKPEIDHTAEDSLSKQLRKFTDWLKHMKNVPPSNDDLGTDPELETAIQGIAQTSNEAKEIVTETMAEVLVKQGKIDKAIQLYIKLSFLNPDKSAYFASKIQILKGI